MDFLIRKLISVYREILYILFRLKRKAALPLGESCSISRFNFEINHGDVVHPCVRYSKNQFKGYHWWLIYTPYYAANADIENPILCYGVSENDEAPTKWKVYSQIIDKPSFGYNSDPTMFFDEGSLHIFWRENSTPRTQRDDLQRATYGCVISENNRHNIEDPILCEKMEFEDKEVSPAIFKYNNAYMALAMHIKFKNPHLHSSNIFFEKMNRLFLGVLSILEIYNEQKSFGIAIWRSESLGGGLEYVKTTVIKNSNKLYRPWHLDVFEYENKLYSVIQTTQCNADICLAVSDDAENFTMFSDPLITNKSIDKVGIYKPTALVHNGIFYLYYTAQDKDNRSLNKMYLTSLPFQNVLNHLS